MTKEVVMHDEQELCSLIADLLKIQGAQYDVKDIGRETTLTDGGIDLTSLDLVRLLVSLEERLDLQLSDEVVMNASFDTVGDILMVIDASTQPSGKLP